MPGRAHAVTLSVDNLQLTEILLSTFKGDRAADLKVSALARGRLLTFDCAVGQLLETETTPVVSRRNLCETQQLSPDA